MKLGHNTRWFVFWGALTALFGILNAQDYGIYTMPNGQTLSGLLMVIAAVMAGYHLSVLLIQHLVKSRHGTPGEVGMLASLLRVVAAIAIGFAILSLFGQLGMVVAALGAFS